jgi:hypothetical protein
VIFNSKQLEEIENINDASGIFEDADDEAAGDEVGEAAMEWRRQLIEEAVENVKRAKTRPVDASITYEVHSLLFDRETRRFARVQRSVPGYLKIGYLNGGDREFGLLDVEGYLKEFGAQKRLSELSLQLGLPDDDVSLRLDELGIQPLEELVEEEPVEAAPPPPPPRAPEPKIPPAKLREALRIEVEEEVDDEEDEGEEETEEVAEIDDVDDVDDVDDIGDDEAGDSDAPIARGKKAPPQKAAKGNAAPMKAAPPTKATATKGAPAKAVPAKASTTKAEKSVVAAKSTRPTKVESPKAASSPSTDKGAAKPKSTSSKGGINPIDDPNGYIKENYQEFSNREMARITGLSEHTIRRKLGEWGLKRKKAE